MDGTMNSLRKLARLIVSLMMVSPLASIAQPSASDDFRINEESYASTSGEQQYPSVASSKGGFTVVWQDDASSLRNDIMLRQYDELGLAQGACMRINDDTTAPLYLPRPRVVRQFPIGVI